MRCRKRTYVGHSCGENDNLVVIAELLKEFEGSRPDVVTARVVASRVGFVFEVYQSFVQVEDQGVGLVRRKLGLLDRLRDRRQVRDGDLVSQLLELPLDLLQLIDFFLVGFELRNLVRLLIDVAQLLDFVFK